MVFCENRNVKALQEAFEEELGYGRPTQYRDQVRALLSGLPGRRLGQPLRQ